MKNTLKSKQAKLKSPKKITINKKRRFETKFQAYFAIQNLADSKKISNLSERVTRLQNQQQILIMRLYGYIKEVVVVRA